MTTDLLQPDGARATTTANLIGLLAQLDQRRDQLTVAQIDRFHRMLTLSELDLLPFLRYEEQRYCRNTIHVTDYYELLVLCWKNGQRSRIHNHQGSLCGVQVLQGVATETTFSRTVHGQVYATSSRHLSAGSIFVNNDEDIHQIANLQPPGNNLITLHLYSPPLRNMLLFSLESDKVEQPQSNASWIYEI